MPSNHEVHLPKCTFEGAQDLWLKIRTVIIEPKGHAFTCPLLGVIDNLTEIIKLGVVYLDVVSAWEESCDRLCFNLAILWPHVL